MKRTKLLTITAIILASLLLLVACGEEEDKSSGKRPDYFDKIENNDGTDEDIGNDLPEDDKNDSFADNITDHPSIKPFPSEDPIFKMSDKEVLESITDETASLSGMCGDSLYWHFKDGILVIWCDSKMYDYNTVNYNAPWYQLEIRRVVIADQVPNIGNNAFRGLTKLEMVSIPDSVETIGRWAFKGCTSLKEIKIPNVSSLGRAVFEDCSSLKTATISGPITYMDEEMFWKCTSLENVALPESLEQISDKTFLGCTSLKKIDIPANVKRINLSAFRDCSSLKEMNLSENIEVVSSYAFSGCTSLESVTMPGITGIGEECFYGCSSLKNVTLSEKIKIIESEAFAYCSSLRTLNIPAGTQWDIDAFHHSGLESFNMKSSSCQAPILEGCVNLKTFEFSDNATEITNPHMMFLGCVNLQEVYLPSGVEYDAAMLFKDCPNVKVINK